MNSRIRLNIYKNNLINRLTIKESILEIILLDNKIRFEKQCIIPPYIVDFLLPKKNLIIELDGECHNRNIQKEKDYKREDYLMSIGYMVQRFSNEIEDKEIIKTIKMYPNLDRKVIKKTMDIRLKLLNISCKKNIFNEKFNDFRDLLIKEIIESNKCSIVVANKIMNNIYKGLI